MVDVILNLSEQQTDEIVETMLTWGYMMLDVFVMFSIILTATMLVRKIMKIKRGK